MAILKTFLKILEKHLKWIRRCFDVDSKHLNTFEKVLPPDAIPTNEAS